MKDNPSFKISITGSNYHTTTSYKSKLSKAMNMVAKHIKDGDSANSSSPKVHQ